MDKIDLGVVTAFALRARPDDQKDSVAVGTIHQMMAVWDAGLEARRIAWPHNGLAFVFDQHQFALNHIHEFVFLLVPMARRRSCTGPQPHEVDAELALRDAPTLPGHTSTDMTVDLRGRKPTKFLADLTRAMRQAVRSSDHVKQVVLRP